MSCLSMAMAGCVSLQTKKPLKMVPSKSNEKKSGGVCVFTGMKINGKKSGGVCVASSGSLSRCASSESEVFDSETEKYYFVVANAKFMLDEEEHFKELMFERLRLFGERSKEQDFWLVIEPKFLDNFPDITKRLRRPAVALVSTNASWITFMKLRLDRVLSQSYQAHSLEEALASNPTHIHFDKPDKWVAPYPKYDYGWWEAFLPPTPTPPSNN